MKTTMDMFTQKSLIHPSFLNRRGSRSDQKIKQSEKRTWFKWKRMDKWTSDIIAWVRRRNDRKMSTFWTLADGAGNLKTPAGWWWWSFKSYFLVLQIKFSISRKSFFGVNFQDSIQYTIRDVRKDNDFARVTLVCAESGLDCITDDHQMKEHKTFYDHLHGRIGFNTVNPSQGRIVKSWIDDE